MLDGAQGRPKRDSSADGATERAGRVHEALFRALETITRLTGETITVAEGLTQTLDILCEALRWPLGHVYHFADEGSEVLTSAALWHIEGPERFAPFQEATGRTTFTRGRGLVGQVLAEGRPGLSSDVSRDRRFVRRRAAAAVGLRSWVAFPVIADGRVVAVCELLTTEPGAIDQSLASLLGAAGLALGRLYERERWRAEAEALRHKLAERARPALEPSREALSALAAAVTHEVNSPLFAARTSLALLAAERPDSPLLAGAQADLARVAAVMETLGALAQDAPLGQRVAQFVAWATRAEE